MKIFNLITAAVFLLTPCAPYSAQRPGGREPLPESQPKRPPRTRSEDSPKRSGLSVRRKGVKATPARAALSVSVTPSDSTISLRGVEYRAENGLFIRDGLNPGTYKVIIRRDGYRAEEYEVGLASGSRIPLSVSLEPLNGLLNVTPPVAGTEIHIIERSTGRRVGVYSERAHRIELPPGRYQVRVSKEGYEPAVREVVIEPTANVSLEPSLTPLPRPDTTPRRGAAPPFRPDSATQAQVTLEGKYVVVVLSGRSGDAGSALGAIDVTLSVGGGRAYVTNVSGIFTGYPCQVDFVRLENVAEYSFVEPPGMANQWARAVVRLRPKETKRPVHFLINWKSLRGLTPDGSPAN